MSETTMLAKHEQQIRSLEARMNRVEDMQKDINSLAMSVEKLALVQSNMVEELKDTKKDVDEIRNQPAKDWHEIKIKVIIGVLSGLASSIVAVIITLLAKGGF